MCVRNWEQCCDDAAASYCNVLVRGLYHLTSSLDEGGVLNELLTGVS